MAKKTTGNERGAAVRMPPPLVYAGVILGGVLLQRFVLPLPLGLTSAVNFTVAVVLAALGILIIGNPFVRFKRSGQDPEPWRPTPVLISDGIYRFTRNPMYIGMALLQSAAAFGFANGWFLILVPVSLLGVYSIAVRHEEAYLEQKFGKSYVDYKSSVRRWL